MEKTKTISLFSDLTKNSQTIENIENCIEITLGPTGKTALLATPKQEVKFLTSGASLLQSLEFPTHTANLVVKLIEQAATKTASIAGDGSTLTLLLTCQLLQTSFRYLMSGYNVVFLTTGLKKIAYFLLEKTAEFAVPVSNSTQLFGLLKTCLGKKVTPQIFSLLKRGIEQIGRDGLLLLEENVSTEHDIEIVQGIELDKGFASSYFVNDLKNFEVNYDNPYILLLRTPLTSMNQIRPVIDYIKENNKPLIIVVEEIQKDILSSLVLNSIQKKIKVAVVKYTAIKFMKNGLLEDLALLTHSNYFEENLKVSQKNFSVQDLGQAKKVIIKKDKSTFLISKFSRVLVNRRINELNRELLLTDSDYEKSLLKTRIARLAGQIAKIKLGSSNQYELDELKLKVEKCLQTVKSSLEEGILPGAGSFYLTLNNQLASWASFNLLGEEILAASIVNSALQRPTRQLLTNANILSPSLVNQIEELGYPYAYDVVEQTNVESFQHGLVDSAKSIRATLWNSITIVSSILTSY